MLISRATREDWQESIFLKSRSENSRHNAINAMKKWDLFLKEKHPDREESFIINELKNNEGKPELYLFLNGFVQFCQIKGVSSRTIKQYFMYVKSWLRANGIRIHADDTKEFIRFPKHMRELRKPLTYDMIRSLLDNGPPKIQALLLTLVSSGMRVSEALQLRMKDINFDIDPVEVNVRPETTKTLEERTAYISKEAVEAINKISGNKSELDYVFVKHYSKTATLSNIEARFSRLRKKCALDATYSNNKNHHVNIHSFRAFFHTQATKALGGDIAHAILGHHKYLDQYFRLSPEERAKNYHDLEPFITIRKEIPISTESH